MHALKGIPPHNGAVPGHVAGLVAFAYSDAARCGNDCSAPPFARRARFLSRASTLLYRFAPCRLRAIGWTPERELCGVTHSEGADHSTLQALLEAGHPYRREGVLDFKNVVHHADREARNTSIRLIGRRTEAVSSPQPGRSAAPRTGRTSTANTKPNRSNPANRQVSRTGNCRMSGLAQHVPSLGVQHRYSTPTLSLEASGRLTSHIREFPDSPARSTG